jgi:hypothetical protein
MKRLLGPSIIIVVLVFSSPCQRQRELLPSLGVSRLLTFYFRGEDFFKSANQKQELPMVAMFVDES